MKQPMCISVQTQDRKIYRKDRLAAAIYQAATQDRELVIDFNPEGSCAEQLGLYRMLDEFCASLTYAKNRITIRTGNLLEFHTEYQVERCPTYWYEIPLIQQWIKTHPIDTGSAPVWHFGSFVSRSTWARLWVSAYLSKNHGRKTLQTYHYDRSRENFNGNGYVGVDDLYQFECDIVPDCVDFLQSCPRTIDIDYLSQADTSNSIFQHHNSYYPIQFPANLNLLTFYRNIFVDIVHETNIMGNNFFVTEKLWRCILARRPFIVLGPGSFFYNLRKLGFQTFGRWWSEDYDGQIGQTRIGMMIDVIDDIANWSREKFLMILEEMQPILQNNYDLFMQLDHEKLAQVFDRDTHVRQC